MTTLTPVQQEYIDKAVTFVQSTCEDRDPGHDWWHMLRVWKLASILAEAEGADRFTVEMAALLHDVDDWKFTTDTEQSRVKQWLADLGLEPEMQQRIIAILAGVSFKGGHNTNVLSIEAQVVQDADRLDAIGAIGIARVFNFGGYKGREIHNPNQLPQEYTSVEEYKRSQATSINHFHEKLLKLYALLNTKTARRIGERRHQYMKDFLTEFQREWNEDLGE